MSLFIVLLLGTCITINIGSFHYAHNEILELEDNGAVGGNIILNSKEKLVNDYLMKLKLAEIEEGLKNPLNYAPALHFFHAKNKIKKSKVFQFLRKLPKGATLHSTNDHIVSQEYIFNLTYIDNLYGCMENGVYKFRVFNGSCTNDCDWQLISELRKNHPNFDEFLKSQLSMIVDDPYTVYPTVESVWKKYDAVSATIESLIWYKPVFEEYLYRCCVEIIQDNMLHLESRIRYQKVYDLTGKIYNYAEVAEIYSQVLMRVITDYPKFTAQIVYKPSDVVDNATLSASIDFYFKMREIYGNYFAGFELSCLDETLRPISDFLPQIKRLVKNSERLFYHGKEIQWSTWYDKIIRPNVIDSSLLNVKRIGHGQAIVKTSVASKIIKQKNIGIELTPIANQVLKLSEDHKNNPGSILIAHNYPVIITSDDGALWGARGLSYDWYITFMALADDCQDLRLLKQLALNSLYFSSFSQTELDVALKLWQKKWDRFIDEICLVESL